MRSSIKSLKDNFVFRGVNKLGRKIIAANLILILAPKNRIFDDAKVINDEFCYCGIKASRKLGNAVLRNKVKRRLKHIFRNLARDLSLNLNNSAVVFIPRARCATIKFENLQQEIKQGILSVQNTSI
jgi:ribonuclease P protein component